MIRKARYLRLTTPRGRTDVHFAIDARRELLRAARGGRLLVVVDRTVARLYGETLGFASIPGVQILRISPGEAAKGLETAVRVWSVLEREGYRRNERLVAIGGGATLDLVGFVASTWMRGTEWLAFPTTLVGQCDACLGGKTAVNFAGGKNLIGTFHPATSVFIDPSFLQTVPVRDHNAGRFELLKCGWLGDRELRRLALSKPVAERRRPALVEAVRRALRVKARHVAGDEEDRGRRRLLNLGHTFAHALESSTGLGRLRHGEAVGIGLLAAAIASNRLGLLGKRAFESRVGEVRALAPPVISRSSLTAALAAAANDKKRIAGTGLVLVLPTPRGAVVQEGVSFGDFSGYLSAALEKVRDFRDS